MLRCAMIGLLALVTTADPQQSGKPDISLKESRKITPYPPAVVNVTRKNRAAVIEWKEVPLERIVAYEIFRSVNHGPFKKLGRVKSPPFLDKSLPKGNVVYAVASVDRDNNRSTLMKEDRP